MCNLYKMRHSADEVANWSSAMTTPGLNFAETVYPGYQGLVIEGGHVRTMTWGFPVRLKHMKPTSKPKAVTNARNDKLHSPFWKPSFEARRCLIPATEWAEPQGEPRKMTCTWHSLPDCELFAIAGLWRPTAEWGDAYTMVMVDSCEQMAEIHDRMPVILKREDWAQWTAGSSAEAFDLVRTWCDPLTIDRTDQRWGAADAPRLL
jgi:putative SOS response-associated peptidase YedK